MRLYTWSWIDRSGRFAGQGWTEAQDRAQACTLGKALGLESERIFDRPTLRPVHDIEAFWANFNQYAAPAPTIDEFVELEGV